MATTHNRIKVYVVYDSNHDQESTLAREFMSTITKRHPQIQLIDFNRTSKSTQDQSTAQDLERCIRCSKAVVIFDSPKPNPDLYFNAVIQYAAIYNKVMAVTTPHNRGVITSFVINDQKRIIPLQAIQISQPFNTGTNKHLLEKASDLLWHFVNK